MGNLLISCKDDDVIIAVAYFFSCSISSFRAICTGLPMLSSTSMNFGVKAKLPSLKFSFGEINSPDAI